MQYELSLNGGTRTDIACRQFDQGATFTLSLLESLTGKLIRLETATPDGGVLETIGDLADDGHTVTFPLDRNLTYKCGTYLANIVIYDAGLTNRTSYPLLRIRVEKTANQDVEKPATVAPSAIAYLQEKQAATDTLATVNKSRIDTLVNSGSGGGTSDTELQDIRVDNNGTTHTSAGNAVRNMINGALKACKDNTINEAVFEANPAYKNADTVPSNSILTYAGIPGDCTNFPPKTTEGGTLITMLGARSSTATYGGTVQLFVSRSNIGWTRMCWGRPGASTWGEWKRLDPPETEKLFGSEIFVEGSAYLDLDKVCENGTYIYSFHEGNDLRVINLPERAAGTLHVWNFDGAKIARAGMTQTFITASSAHVYMRSYWMRAGADRWSSWTRLDHVEETLPSIAMFEKIGILGDSFTVGQINSDATNAVTKSALSWGKILGRKNGVQVTNYGKGGLSTKTFMEDDAALLTKFKAAAADNLYVITFGINDTNKAGLSYLGTSADIHKGNSSQNPATFYGNYGKIIELCQAKNAGVKVILSTVPYNTGNYITFNNAIVEIAGIYGLPVIRQDTDDFIMSSFFRSHMIGNHPTAPLYTGMATAIEKMIGRAVLNNIDYFQDYIGLK